MNKDYIYNNGRIAVSEQIFKAPKRTYRVSQIEKIDLKRPLFLVAVPLAAFSYLLLKEYEPYLFEHEKIACMLMFSVVPFCTWFIGTLSVTSKSYRDDQAIFGFMPSLKKAREALENVIFDQTELRQDEEKDDE